MVFNGTEVVKIKWHEKKIRKNSVIAKYKPVLESISLNNKLLLIQKIDAYLDTYLWAVAQFQKAGLPDWLILNLS